MGGCGSTRWGFHSKKLTVEECKSLSTKLFKESIKDVIETQCNYGGKINWSRRGELSGNIGFNIYVENNLPIINFQYSFTESGLKMDYPVKLTYSTVYWGSKRWWFICPLSKNGKPCNRRVGKLYLPPGGKYFGCRHCYDLTYTSCQESHRFDSLFGLLMADSIAGFSSSDAKFTLKQLEKRWMNEQFGDIFENRLAEIEEAERKRKEKFARYLTAEELCRRSGLTLEGLKSLNEFRLLVPDTKDGRYRPKLVGWGKKLKIKIDSGSSYLEIKNWARNRWG